MQAITTRCTCNSSTPLEETRTDRPSFFYIKLYLSAFQDLFAAFITSESVEALENHLLFPDGYLLPLSAQAKQL